MRLNADICWFHPAFASGLTAAEGDSENWGREKPSDQAPVWITLSLEAGRQIRPGILYLD